MSSLYHAVIFCCLSLLLSACFAPRQVIRIAPEESEKVFWHQGQAIAEVEENQILARAAYSHANRDYLVFDVEVFNESDRSCLLSPENFSLMTAQDLRIRAANPEVEMFSMDMDASRREALTKNWAIVGGVALVAGAVAVAASSDGEGATTNGYVDDSYDVVDAGLDLAEGVSMVAWGLSFRSDPVLSVSPDVLPEIASYDFWQNVALRRTTIMPGASVRGLVAFPRKTATEGSLLLAVPLECAIFSFRFKQRNFQP